jgi:hypothetical protein
MRRHIAGIDLAMPSWLARAALQCWLAARLTELAAQPLQILSDDSWRAYDERLRQQAERRMLSRTVIAVRRRSLRPPQ